MQKLLTVGFAHYDDFDGAYFTLNSARLSIPEEYRDLVEFVAVDTGNGNSKHSEMLRGQMSQVGPAGKYVHFPGGGTSTGRNRVVEAASGKFVLVLDCHVLLPPQTWEFLLDAVHLWSNGEDTQDQPGLIEDGEMPHLIQGPLLMDNQRHVMTHFYDRWDAEMWGKWGFGMQCNCGAVKFTPADRNGFECIDFKSNQDVRTCEHCGANWSTANREEDLALTGMGCRPLVTRDRAYSGLPAFDVPGQGLGLFLTSKEHWLQFHPQATGFGAEEMCVHALYRQAGRRTVVMPWLLWQHRFGRAGGIPYRLDKYTKMRNYVLWFLRLGWDLEPISRHFVDEMKMPNSAWVHLLDDPIANVNPPVTSRGCSVSNPRDTLEGLFNRLKGVERDLNQHMPALRSMVDGGVVVEITNRQESTVAFAAALPKELHSFQLEMSNEANAAYNALRQVGMKVNAVRASSDQVTNIPECDVLFIDSEHTYARLSEELSKFSGRCRRFIAMHDTMSFGRNGDGGGQGLQHAIADFLYSHGEWSVAVHSEVQHGLTVLARDPKDRHPEFIRFLPGRGYGPGSHMKSILKSLGINPSPTCDCGPVSEHMDALGVVGCKAYLPQIVKKVTDNASKWGWTSFASAAVKAVATGLALRINPLDPYGSLVRIAIEDAEKESESGKLHDPIWK